MPGRQQDCHSQPPSSDQEHLDDIANGNARPSGTLKKKIPPGPARNNQLAAAGDSGLPPGFTSQPHAEKKLPQPRSGPPHRTRSSPEIKKKIGGRRAFAVLVPTDHHCHSTTPANHASLRPTDKTRRERGDGKRRRVSLMVKNRRKKFPKIAAAAKHKKKNKTTRGIILHNKGK